MEVLMGKSSINGPFSMAMLNNQRVVPADFPEKKTTFRKCPGSHYVHSDAGRFFCPSYGSLIFLEGKQYISMLEKPKTVKNRD
jgi:hypothetical protein